MNTEQLKTAEEILKQQMIKLLKKEQPEWTDKEVEEMVDQDLASEPEFVDHFIVAMEIFASQESKIAVEKDRESRWISVKDRPLVSKTERGWVATEDGDKEFLAAVELTNGWWIKHCVLEDEIGLCVVGDSENEPAGYLIEDVLFYQHITPPKL